MLQESDLISVRDLYKRIKEILCQENTERIFKITDSQLLKLHSDIDAMFESMLTDNPETDDLFNRATQEKTARRKMMQDVIDIKEAATAHDEFTKPSTLKAKRENKVASKRQQAFRPHDQDLKLMDHVRENYKTMLNLGFLEMPVLQSNVGAALNVPQAVARPGRPVNIPLTYEDIMQVEKWDDSKLVF